MLSRADIKANAKEAMKQQWGTSIGAIVLTAVIAGAAGYIGGIFMFLLFIPTFAVIAFVSFPLSVGMQGVFAKIYRKEQTDVGQIFKGFSGNYMRKVGGMAWMALFVWLWTLLFIIPGIIKGISYSMIPFILAESPNVPAREAMKLSMRMTNGYKGEIFVMYLSFIGWYLLSFLTCGILALVYVNPYANTTYAGYYVELKRRAIESGTISPAEFGEEIDIVVEENLDFPQQFPN